MSPAPHVSKIVGKLQCRTDCSPMPDWLNNPVTLGGGLIATIVVTVVLTRRAGRLSRRR